MSWCKLRYMACQQACSTAPDRQPLLLYTVQGVRQRRGGVPGGDVDL